MASSGPLLLPGGMSFPAASPPASESEESSPLVRFRQWNSIPGGRPYRFQPAA